MYPSIFLRLKIQLPKNQFPKFVTLDHIPTSPLLIFFSFNHKANFLKYIISHNSALYIKPVYEVGSLILPNEWQYGDERHHLMEGHDICKYERYTLCGHTKPCPLLRHYPNIFLEGLGRIWTWNLSSTKQSNQSPDSGVVQAFKLGSVTYVAHIINSNATVRANIHKYIQSDPGGMCQTSGGCSLC